MKNYSIHILFIFLFVLSFKIEAQTKKENTAFDKEPNKKNIANINSQKTTINPESNLRNAEASNIYTPVTPNTTNAESNLKTASSSNTVVINPTDTVGIISNKKHD